MINVGHIRSIHMSNWGYGNTPNNAKNNITIRSYMLAQHLPATRASKNLVEAHFKVLRLFRKCCRMAPAIIKYHQLQHIFNRNRRINNNIQARLHLANAFRQSENQRDLDKIDNISDKANEILLESQIHHNYEQTLWQFMCPNTGDQGYSIMEQKKHPKLSNFSRTFLKGSKSHDI